MTILDIQKALIAAGFNPGTPDGVMGPRTRKAIIAFQKSKGLETDGVVGAVTAAALFGSTFKADDPNKAIPLHMPWLIEAHRHMGLQEGVGKANNKTILEWADDLDLNYTADEIPWCGLFVAHCMGSSLPEEPLPKHMLSSRQWSNYGMKCTPQFGSILVFWRGTKEGWQGHVGFYWAEDGNYFHVLGGNQSNKVSIARLDKDRFISARYPTSLPALGIIRKASENGVLISDNES